MHLVALDTEYFLADAVFDAFGGGFDFSWSFLLDFVLRGPLVFGELVLAFLPHSGCFIDEEIRSKIQTNCFFFCSSCPWLLPLSFSPFFFLLHPMASTKNIIFA